MITTTELSHHRKRLRQFLDKIEKLAFHCAYPDPLIQGTSGEVFRTCGKKIVNARAILPNDMDRISWFKFIKIKNNDK